MGVMRPRRLFGRRKKEAISEVSSELGIPEEQVEKLAAKLATNEKFVEVFLRKVDYKVARRVLMAMVGGGLLTLSSASALARMIVTDRYIDLDGQKFYPSPIGGYSAIVMKQETDVWAEDEYGKTIAEGVAGVDDAEVVQNVVDKLTTGIIKLQENLQINSDILIQDKHRLHLLGEAKLSGSGRIIIRGTTSYENSTHNSIEKLELNGVGVVINDSYRTVFRDLKIKDANTAIELQNLNTWSEFTLIENVDIDNCQNGIVFKTPTGTGRSSYANTQLNHVTFNLFEGQRAIVNESGATPSGIGINNRFWIHGDNTKVIDVYDHNHIWFVNPTFESFVSSPTAVYGIYCEATSFIELPRLTNPRFLGNYTLKVYNPNNYPLDNIVSGGTRYKPDGIPIGVNDQYGTPKKIEARKIPTCAQIIIGGTLATGETITVKIEVVYSNGTVKYIERSYTATGTYTLNPIDFVGLFKYYNDIIDKINVYAKSDQASTSATVTFKWWVFNTGGKLRCKSTPHYNHFNLVEGGLVWLNPEL